MTERPASDMSMGSLVETGRNMDLAIEGKGSLRSSARMVRKPIPAPGPQC